MFSCVVAEGLWPFSQERTLIPAADKSGTHTLVLDGSEQ